VKSHLTSSKLRNDPAKPVMSKRAHAEIDQYMLQL
jgi:hypothetical protein